MPAKTHWAGLDLIRLLPILVSVTYHYGVETAPAGLYASPVLTSPAYGDLVHLSVFLMILLSGAGLGAKYAARPCRPAEYIRSRAAAIYPVFWLCFVPLFLYSDVWHRNNAAVPLWKLGLSLVGLDGYLQAYTPTFYKVGEWYLGCQVLLYCLFPLTLWATRTQRRRLGLGAAAVLVWAAGPWLRFLEQGREFRCAEAEDIVDAREIQGGKAGGCGLPVHAHAGYGRDAAYDGRHEGGQHAGSSLIAGCYRDNGPGCREDRA